MIVILAGVVIALVTLASMRSSGVRRKRLAGRDRLTVEEFFHQFYSETGIAFSVVREALWEIANATDVEEGYLRPEDRFDDVLRPAAGWEHDDGLNLLGTNLLQRARKAGISLDLPTIRSVDDYVRSLNRVNPIK